MFKPFFLILAAAWTAGFARAQGGPYTTNAVASAFVATGPTGNLSSNNYGGGGALVVAAGNLPNGAFQTVIKFDLSGALATFNAQYGVGLWSIQSISLQLTASPHGNPIYNPVAAGQFSVSLMQNSSWIEGTGTASLPTSDGISYSTLESTYINAAADEMVGTFNFGGQSTGTFSYLLNLASNLTAGVLDGGIVSLRLYAADTNISYLFTSSHAIPVSQAPLLTISAVSRAASLVNPRVANGQFSFSYNAIPGSSYAVQASSDLAHWLPVVTNLASTNLVAVLAPFSTRSDS